MSLHPGNDLAGGGDDADVDTTTDAAPAPGSVVLPAPRTAPDASGPSRGVGSSRVAPPPVVPAQRAAPVRPAPAPARRPGWLEIGVAAVAYVGLLVVLHAVTDADGVTTGPWLAVVSAVAALGAVAAALAVRVRSLAPLCLRPARPAMLATGLGLGLATWLLARGGVALWTDLGGTLPPAQPGLMTFTGPASTIALVVLVGLVVPCVEEMLFRGVLVSALGRYGMVVAALGSAALFAAAHGLTFAVFAALVLGTANAVMIWRWRTIWPGVVAHAAFNFVSLGLAFALS